MVSENSVRIDKNKQCNVTINCLSHTAVKKRYGGRGLGPDLGEYSNLVWQFG